MKKIIYVLVIGVILSCESKDDFQDTTNSGTGDGGNVFVECSETRYSDWRTSIYVLPYPVGVKYPIGLSHCSGSFHSFGKPDQYAVDFNMPIGDLITASRNGKVIFVEQSGEDYSFPNNKVVIEHVDGTYGQYMHLTKNGAIVSVGQTVSVGTPLGYSGATGTAGYPHLHFVITTKDGWEYPYFSMPMNFRNTTANPRSLEQGETYEALPY